MGTDGTVLSRLAPAGVLDLGRLAARFGDAPALRWRNLTLSYRAYAERIATTAAELQARGVTAGARVALSDQEPPVWAVTLFALMAVGAVAVLLPARAAARERDRLLALTGAVELDRLPPPAGRAALPIGEPQHYPTRVDDPAHARPRDHAASPTDHAASPTDHTASLPDHTASAPAQGGAAGRPQSARPTGSPAASGAARIGIARPATVVFTSGSSGAPKAVVHSAANHLYNAAGSAANIPVQAGDAWLVALPLHHVAGLSILFRTLSAGACAVIADGGSLRDAADPAVHLLPEVTHVSLVETQLRRLLQLPDWPGLTRRLRAVLIGGSALSPPLLRQARAAGLPVCASYGCTEMASQVATTPLDAAAETFSDGAPVLPHRRVAISGVGEILLGGPTLCLGYLQEGRIVAAGADGWFASGDLGRLDGQRLSVTGRRDARFISGGENIQPEEVEQALLEHPAVTAAVCVPVADAEFGRRAVAFLALRAGPLPPADLEYHLNARLARFKHPARYFPLPATAPAEAPLKHLRAELAAQAANIIGTSDP